MFYDHELVGLDSDFKYFLYIFSEKPIVNVYGEFTPHWPLAVASYSCFRDWLKSSCLACIVAFPCSSWSSLSCIKQQLSSCRAKSSGCFCSFTFIPQTRNEKKEWQVHLTNKASPTTEHTRHPVHLQSLTQSASQSVPGGGIVCCHWHLSKCKLMNKTNWTRWLLSQAPAYTPHVLMTSLRLAGATQNTCIHPACVCVCVCVCMCKPRLTSADILLQIASCWLYRPPPPLPLCSMSLLSASRFSPALLLCACLC